MLGLHCLSASRPPGSPVWFPETDFYRKVSIAFRRHGPPAPARTASSSMILLCLHCLSASRPPGSKYDVLHFRQKFGGLHCLSASRPPGSRFGTHFRSGLRQVSIAFRRHGPPALRPLNRLAGGVARAVQVTTAGLGHFGPRPRRTCTRVNLHNSLAFGQLGIRSGAGLFWGFWGPDLIRDSRGISRSRPSGRRSWFPWRSGRQSCRRRPGPPLR